VATISSSGQTRSIERADFDRRLEDSPSARAVLQQMAQEALIDEYARADKITVTPGEIDKKEAELKVNFPGAAWNEMLSARGLTEAEMRNTLRDQIVIDKAIGKRIKISDAQITAYFNRNRSAFDIPQRARARHILVADRSMAAKVEGQLRSGGDFASLARRFSIDSGTKNRGGEIGWFRRGQLVPPIDKAAFSLPVGAISSPVKSPFGYHILQVEERTPARKVTLEATHDRIAEMLRQQQEAPFLQSFLTNLEQRARVTTSDPRFDDLFGVPAWNQR